MQRELLEGTVEAVEPADVLIAKTAPQLLHALQNGHQDIEIRNHLDVSSVTTSRLLAHVFSTTRSVRGNCDETEADKLLTVNGEPLAPLTKKQCLIVTDTSLLSVTVGDLWVDRLYIRHHLPAKDTDADVVRTGALVSVAGKGKLFMTDVTLQGDGIDRMQGLRVLNAGRLYAYDSRVLNLCGSTESTAAVVIGPKGADVSSANFIEVTFAGRHSCEGQSQSNHAHSSVYGYKKNAYVHTQQCTFRDTVGDAPLWAADHALFFSNDGVALAGDWDGAPRVTEPLPESFYDFFAQPADPWLLGVQQALRDAPGSAFRESSHDADPPPEFSSVLSTAPPAAPDRSSASDPDSFSPVVDDLAEWLPEGYRSTTHVAAAAGGFVLLLLLCVWCCCCRARRNRRRRERTAIPRDIEMVHSRLDRQLDAV